MKTYVLYHAYCADGFGGAWAAWRALGDSAEYVAVSYGERPPAIPDGAKVVLIDFAYPREAILEMAARAGRLAVLDHHKTSQEDLAGLPFAVFEIQNILR